MISDLICTPDILVPKKFGPQKLVPKKFGPR